MSKVIEFFIKRSFLVNLIAFAIIVIGTVFAVTTRRVAMPEVQLDVLIIQTVYPGASSVEVERNVTRYIEEAIKGTAGIKEFFSTSRKGYSGIFIELESDLDNPESAVNDIRQAVDSINDLPELAESPRVIRIGSRNIMPALSVNLSSEDKNVDIYRLAEELEQLILETKGVSSVDFEGFHEKEIKVDIDQKKLFEKHLSIRDVINAIKAHNISYPCGVLDEGDSQVMVSLNSRINTAKDVENIIIKANYSGYSVRVRDIANVYSGFNDSSYAVRTNGKQSVNLRVNKMKSGDNISISNRVKEICGEFRIKKMDAGVVVIIEIVDDVSDFIKNRLNVVKNNAAIGIILVVISLFVFLNWRVALFTAAGLPVAFGIMFIVMGYFDITINMISMVGMIIVLGMLVDDAIIVSENIYRHMEEGEERLRAVVTGTTEVIGPVTGTVLTTIAAFTPLFWISGVMGKFIFHLPVVVMVALAASLIEAMIILPVHAYDFARVSSKDRKAAEGKSSGFFVSFRAKYTGFLTSAIKHRYAAASTAIIMLVIVIGMFIVIMMPRFELFPSEGIEMFFMRFALPTGTKKEVTLQSVAKIEEIIERELKTNELKDYVTRVGSDQTPHGYIFNVGEEYGTIIIYLTDKAKRERGVNEMIEVLDRYTKPLKEDGMITRYAFEKFKPGPPQGSSISIEIIGEDPERTGDFSDKIIAFLQDQEGVLQVESSAGTVIEEVEVVIDGEKAERAGIRAAEVGEFLRASFEGVIASSVKGGEKEVEIRVRLPEGWAGNRGSIKDILIGNYKGNLVPLEKISDFKTHKIMQAVHHKGGRRFVRITGDMNTKIVSPKQINKMVMDEFADYKNEFPECTLEVGGEARETQESLQDIAKAALVAIFLIFIILTAVFNSPFHPFLVLLAVPFGFAGVVIAFLLHGEIFTFVAMIGVIGMTGVVVNDAIVLVSYIKSLREKGMAKVDSIIKGGEVRLRPVILTSITTLLGLAPTAYNIGGKDPFLPVVALAIGWGLLFATVVTLVLIPCFYAIGDDIYDAFKRR